MAVIKILPNPLRGGQRSITNKTTWLQIFARRPQRWGLGSKAQNPTSSEYDHVAYQIKGNDVTAT